MNDRMNHEQVGRKRAVVALLGLLFTASMQAQGPAPKPGPEYKAYEVWLGDWQYEGEAQDSPIGPGGKYSGRTTVRWVLDGWFMEFRSQERGNLGDLEVVEFDWYDAAAKNYPYQGYINNGDRYSATATVNGRVWKNSGTQTHKGIQYKVRSVFTFAEDGMSDTWKTEISPDGKTWALWNEGKAIKIGSANAAAEQELIQLERGWAEASVKGDVAYLDRTVAEEVTWGNFKGKWLTKAQALAEYTSGEYGATSEVLDNMKVRVYGDTAVVTGRTSSKSQYQGADSSGQYIWTDTWVKRGGRWQCVATHASKVVAK